MSTPTAEELFDACAWGDSALNAERGQWNRAAWNLAKRLATALAEVEQLRVLVKTLADGSLELKQRIEINDKHEQRRVAAMDALRQRAEAAEEKLADYEEVEALNARYRAALERIAKEDWRMSTASAIAREELRDADQ